MTDNCFVSLGGGGGGGSGNFLGRDFFSRLLVLHDNFRWTIACARIF